MAIEKKSKGTPVVEQPALPQHEQIRHPETSAEQSAEFSVAHESKQDELDKQVNEPLPQPPAVHVAIKKDPQLMAIEKILSQDMTELYSGLPPNIQPIFKAKGEEVSSKIQAMFNEASVVARKVLMLIREWLGIVPNVNKFYLEQESKIKTDQIMDLANMPPQNQI